MKEHRYVTLLYIVRTELQWMGFDFLDLKSMNIYIAVQIDLYSANLSHLYNYIVGFSSVHTRRFWSMLLYI